MVNTYDARSYTRAFEWGKLKKEEEVVFGIQDGRRLRAVTGLVTGIFKNRLDETDVWIRVRKYDDFKEEDFLYNKMVFSGDNVEPEPYEMIVKFKPATGYKKEELTLPKYQTAGAAAFDFHAAEEKDIAPGNMWTVSTGLCMEIPEGWECQIRPRSGFSRQTDILIGNSPGTIDSDYRGEVKIILRNLGKTTYTVKKGERIAQGKMGLAPQFDIKWAEELSDTERGAGGFGSTGKE